MATSNQLYRLQLVTHVDAPITIVKLKFHPALTPTSRSLALLAAEFPPPTFLSVCLSLLR